MAAKVIIHVDENAKWSLALGNTANLLKSYAEESPPPVIEVLANSEAVKGYVNRNSGELAENMKALANKGVLFAACGNALRGLSIARDALFPFVQVVPAGVRELADRQLEGYAYIKP